MKARWRKVVLTAILMLPGTELRSLWGQDTAVQPSVLHIQQSQTTSQTDSPTFLAMYQVLDGANSPAVALGSKWDALAQKRYSGL
jgi:hypothetical protein